MKYKGYIGEAEVDHQAGVIRGRVVNVRDKITFHGRTVKEAERAFRDSVDDYLAYCEELGVGPEEPYSGRFQIRIKPETHRALRRLARAEGVSLNALIARQLDAVAAGAGPSVGVGGASEAVGRETARKKAAGGRR